MTNPSPASDIPKPVVDDKGRLNYSDAIEYLQAKFGFNAWDYRQSRGHYEQWCRKHHKKTRNLDISAQQALYSEYCAAPDGDVACPASENFWHWLMAYIELHKRPTQARLPSDFRLDIAHVLATYDQVEAPLLDTVDALNRPHLERALAALPEELRGRAQRQYAAKPNALPEFVRVILGHFQAEFGSVLKLDVR